MTSPEGGPGIPPLDPPPIEASDPTTTEASRDKADRAIGLIHAIEHDVESRSNPRANVWREGLNLGIGVAATLGAATPAGLLSPVISSWIRGTRAVTGAANFGITGGKFGMEKKLRKDALGTISKPGFAIRGEELIAKAGDDPNANLNEAEQKELKTILTQEWAYLRKGLNVEKYVKAEFSRDPSGEGSKKGLVRNVWESLKEFAKTTDGKKAGANILFYSSPAIAALIAASAPVAAPIVAPIASGLYLATSAVSTYRTYERLKSAQEKAKEPVSLEGTQIARLAEIYQKMAGITAKTESELSALSEKEAEEYINAIQSQADVLAEKEVREHVTEINRDRNRWFAYGITASAAFSAISEYMRSGHSQEQEAKPSTEKSGSTPPALPKPEPEVKPPETPPYRSPSHDSPGGTGNSGVETPPYRSPSHDTPRGTPMPAGAAETATATTAAVAASTETYNAFEQSAPNSHNFNEIYTNGDHKEVILNLDGDGDKDTAEVCRVIERQGKTYVQVTWADTDGNGMPESLKNFHESGKDLAVEIEVTKTTSNGKATIDGVDGKIGFIVNQDDTQGHKFVEKINDDGTIVETVSRPNGLIAQFQTKAKLIQAHLGDKWDEFKSAHAGDMNKIAMKGSVARLGMMMPASEDGIPAMQVHLEPISSSHTTPILSGEFRGHTFEFSPTTAPHTNPEIDRWTNGDSTLATKIKDSVFAFRQGELRLEAVQIKEVNTDTLNQVLDAFKEYSPLAAERINALSEADRQVLLDHVGQTAFDGRIEAFDILRALGIENDPAGIEQARKVGAALLPKTLLDQVNNRIGDYNRTPWQIPLHQLKGVLAAAQPDLEVRFMRDTRNFQDVVALISGKTIQTYIVPPGAFHAEVAPPAEPVVPAAPTPAVPTPPPNIPEN